MLKIQSVDPHAFMTNYIKKCILDSIVNDHATSIVNADEKFYI